MSSYLNVYCCLSEAFHWTGFGGVASGLDYLTQDQIGNNQMLCLRNGMQSESAGMPMKVETEPMENNMASWAADRAVGAVGAKGTSILLTTTKVMKNGDGRIAITYSNDGSEIHNYYDKEGNLTESAYRSADFAEHMANGGTLANYQGGNYGNEGDDKPISSSKSSQSGQAGIGLTAAQIAFNEIVVSIALAEPTPVGEAIVAAVNVGFMIYNMSKDGITPNGKLSRLSKGEEEMLKKSGFDFHEYKPSQGSNGKIDIFKDIDKDLFWSQDGVHFEPTGENWYDWVMKK